MTIGEPAMNAIKQFFLALYEAIHDMKAYQAQKHIENHSRSNKC